MDIKQLEQLEKALEQSERKPKLRTARDFGKILGSGGREKKIDRTLIEQMDTEQLLIIGDECRTRGRYQKATTAYCAAIQRTTAPGEPQVITAPEEREMAITRLERLVKEVSAGKRLQEEGLETRKAAYDSARVALDALKYFHRE
ncbi:MAG: hypothetical protein KKF46_05975 [Nanoarchaeota archaeon]|nr:hypothetical protein [Nanoarchaeota archaeon]MBU1321881.1 hypothetical protein [Nanoarchaeota archaeon]MBU1597656.1 hypothetical protein [Nanoarchaeota archaeon]MBU2442219.1 hypothetical protein [Nanoarchaeota archaeon]